MANTIKYYVIRELPTQILSSHSKLELARKKAHSYSKDYRVPTIVLKVFEVYNSKGVKE